MRKLKDSGIEWISELPITWKIIQAKHMIKISNGSDPILEGNIPVYGSGNGSFKRCGEFKEPPTVLLGRKGTINNPRYIDSRYWNVDTAFDVKTKSDLLSLKYYYYCALSFDYNFYTSQTTLPSMTQTDYGNMYIPLPNIYEQHTIITYLDQKCAEIDSLTADIQKQIETLEEYKHSIITEAVTKGLNPDVEMKESGYRWNPEIPKHWYTIPAKYLFKSSDIRKYPDDIQLTASQKYGIISQKEYMERENAKIVFANQGIENWKHVEPNNFIISLRSFQGGLELSEITGCITWHYIVLKALKPINYRFFKWLFKSSQYINALQGTCNFIRDGQDLRYSNFIQVPLYQPPLDEQQQIADYLDKKCTEIDGIISEKKQQIETIAEYKKSLIFEYVTGKKEVVL